MNFEDLLNDFLSWSLKNGIKLIICIIVPFMYYIEI